MEKSDAEIVREIESTIRDHLAAIKNEARVRILQLSEIDRDKAWEELTAAVDEYGGDMVTDATHWLRHQAHDYSSRRWEIALPRKSQKQ